MLVIFVMWCHRLENKLLQQFFSAEWKKQGSKKLSSTFYRIPVSITYLGIHFPGFFLVELCVAGNQNTPEKYHWKHDIQVGVNVDSIWGVFMYIMEQLGVGFKNFAVNRLIF